jgi:hypothetical protein
MGEMAADSERRGMSVSPVYVLYNLSIFNFFRCTLCTATSGEPRKINRKQETFTFYIISHGGAI